MCNLLGNNHLRFSYGARMGSPSGLRRADAVNRVFVRGDVARMAEREPALRSDGRDAGTQKKAFTSQPGVPRACGRRGPCNSLFVCLASSRSRPKRSRIPIRNSSAGSFSTGSHADPSIGIFVTRRSATFPAPSIEDPCPRRRASDACAGSAQTAFSEYGRIGPTSWIDPSRRIVPGPAPGIHQWRPGYS